MDYNYESEHTKFMREFLEKNPQVEEKRLAARSVWWDKKQNLEERARSRIIRRRKRSNGAIPAAHTITDRTDLPFVGCVLCQVRQRCAAAGTSVEVFVEVRRRSVHIIPDKEYIGGNEGCPAYRCAVVRDVGRAKRVGDRAGNRRVGRGKGGGVAITAAHAAADGTDLELVSRSRRESAKAGAADTTCAVDVLIQIVRRAVHRIPAP